MKKLLLLVFCAIIVVSCSNDDWEAPGWAINGGTAKFERSSSPITQSDAWSLVKNVVLGDNLDDVSVFASETILEPNTICDNVINNVISPDYRSWLIFINDNPRVDGYDKCRYVYVSEYGDVVDVRKYNMGHPFCIPLTVLKNPTWPDEKSATRTFSNLFSYDPAKTNVYNTDYKKHALIIGGSSGPSDNYIRFWNNCSLTYQLLTKVYKFDPSKIHLLVSDGDNPGLDIIGVESSSLDFDFDGNNENVIAATSTNIVTTLNQLRDTLTSNDELFIFITGHGGLLAENQCSLITIWGGYIDSTSFLNLLSQINAKSITLVVTNCHSGFFAISPIVQNSVVLTACKYNETSIATQDYNVFAKTYVDAMKDRNADANQDMQVSEMEAYNYTYPRLLFAQHPQYLSTPSTLGESIGLEDIWQNLSINGNNYFNNHTILSINNQPQGTSVNWNIRKTYWISDVATTTNNISFDNSVTLQNSSNLSCDFGVTLTIDNTYKRMNFTKGATSGAYGPHTGALYWNCNSNSGGSSYNNHNTYVELPIGQTTYFYASYYQGNYGNRVNNPTISACDGLDLNPQAFYTNYVTLQPTESGEGDMLIYLDNGYGEGDPFTIPYIVFDQNSYSLLLNASRNSMSLRKKTNYSSKSAIKSVEIQNAERKVLYKKDFYDVAIARVDAERQLDFPQLGKGTYIIKITDDKVHFLKLVI